MSNKNFKIGIKIKGVFEKRNLSIVDFAKSLNMSTTGVYDIFKRDHINTANLIKISEILDVPISYFFTEDDIPENVKFFNNGNVAIGNKNTSTNTINNSNMFHERMQSLEKEIANLKELIKSKDEIIELLRQKK